MVDPLLSQRYSLSESSESIEPVSSFRLLVENSSDVFALIDSHGRFLFLSPAIERVLGYSPDDLIGIEVVSLIHEEDQEALLRYFHSFEPGPVNAQMVFELRNRRRDGSWCVLETTFNGLTDDSRMVFAITMRDITERKTIDNALNYLAKLGWNNSEKELLPSMLNYLCAAAGADFAFISKISKDEKNFTAIACSTNGKTAHPMPGTPLSFSRPPRNSSGIYSCASHVQDQYPNDPVLREWGVESYCAISLWDSCGQLTGVLTVVSSRPMSNVRLVESLLQIFSTRIASELEHQQIEKTLLIQRDLSIALSATSDLNAALAIVLEAALQFECVDCGGIYLEDPASGGFDLVMQRNLPPNFLTGILHYEAGTEPVKMAHNGRPVFTSYPRLRPKHQQQLAREKLYGLAILPILYEGRTIACMNLASHIYEEIQPSCQVALEAISSQIGGTIARLRAEAAVKTNQKDLQNFFDTIADFVIIADLNGQILSANHSTSERLGYSLQELCQMTISDLVPPTTPDVNSLNKAIIFQKGHAEYGVPLVAKNGEQVPVETRVTYGRWGQQNAVIGINRDLTELLQSQASLHQSETRYRQLFTHMTANLALFEIVCDDMRQPVDFRYLDINPSHEAFSEVPSSRLAGRSIFEILPDIDSTWTDALKQTALTGMPTMIQGEVKRQNKFLEGFIFVPQEGQIAVVFNDVTGRKRTEKEIRDWKLRYELVAAASGQIIFDLEISSGNIYWGGSLEKVLGYQPEELKGGFNQWKDLVLPEDLDYLYSLVNGSATFDAEYHFRHKNGHYVPVLEHAFFLLGSDGNPERMIGVIIDNTERKKVELREKNEKRRMNCLLQITRYKYNSLGDLLRFALEQAVELVDSKYGYLFNYNEERQEFNLTAWSSQIEADSRVANSRMKYYLSELSIWGETARQRRAIITNDFQAYNPVKIKLPSGHIPMTRFMNIPIFSNNEIVAVIGFANKISEYTELDVQQINLLMDPVWKMVERKQAEMQIETLNNELVTAYDATIEGWASALELRDQETEGHSRRVVELTLALSHRLGIPESDLVHIRRGAILHDIGKIGVPDDVLIKQGPLTDREWERMRQHPELAYNLLASIPFLQPALDIPYCHHEHWDGSGYPRKLKGEHIPLAARIFSIVDAWDALSHDRPYRKAWPVEKIISFFHVESGHLFDPRVVNEFIEMIQSR